jgi:hypothetical protein
MSMRWLLGSGAAAAALAVAGCGVPPPGVYPAAPTARVVYGDSEFASLLEESEAVVVVRVRELGPPPLYYVSGFAGAGTQYVTFDVLNTLTGVDVPSELTVVYTVWPSGKYILQGRGPQRLDPMYFRTGRKLILFLPSLEHTAGAPAPDAPPPSAEMDLGEYLRASLVSGIDLSDEALTNRYSKRLEDVTRRVASGMEKASSGCT